MDERRRAFEEGQERVSGIVESRLDDAVRNVFAKYRSALPAELEGLDRDVDQITKEFLDSSGTIYERSQVPGRVEYRIQPSPALPEGYRDGFVGMIGDSRDLSEGEILHVSHPVLQAAIEDARRATSTPLRVTLIPPNGSLPAEVQYLAGRHGRVVVTKAAYRGIEPADNLLTTAVMKDGTDPLSAALVEAVLKLIVRETAPLSDSESWQHLDEAIEEAVFHDQAAVSAREQVRFGQMLGQLDHYLADQVLILRRKRALLDTRIEEMEKRIDKTSSAQSRLDTKPQIEKLIKERNGVDRQIERLQEGGDDEYRGWRDRLFARRFRQPEVTRLLDVHFEIAAGDAAC
jgi:hypothetical protein